MRLKILIALALTALGVGAVGLTLFSGSGTSATSQYLTSTATRTTVSKDAVATGTVGAQVTYGLAFGQPPQVIASASDSGSGTSGSAVVTKVSVAVGDGVKSGDTLASIDTGELEVALAIASANLSAATARLATDKGGMTDIEKAQAADAITQAQLSYQAAVRSAKGTTAQNDLTVAQAQDAVAAAEKQLAKDKAGPDADTIASAQDALDQATLSLQTAQQDLVDMKAKTALSIESAEGAVSDAQVKLANDEARHASADTLTADSGAVIKAQQNLASVQLQADSSVTQAETQITSAEQALAAAQRAYKTKTTPSTTVLDADRQALEAAKSNLRSAQLKASSSSGSVDDQLSQAQHAITTAQLNYEAQAEPATADQIATDTAAVSNADLGVTSAREALERATLTSPVDGTVVSVSVYAAAAAPSGFAVVVQSRQLQISADFTESDVPSLALGQAARVTISATDSVVEGTVTQIKPVASTSGSSSVVTYAVVVGLKDPPAEVRSGMSADVSVTTASAADVIAVPAIALVGASGNYAVRVVDAAGSVSLRTVKVGLITTALAEITDGVTEGETVVTGSTTASSSTGTSSGGGLPFGGPGGGGVPVDGGGFPGGGRGLQP
jgi:multidrug resistance efflux pump